MLLKYANVRDALSCAGLSLRRVDGEYRVTIARLEGTKEGEAMAYYTDDLEDAYYTGLNMKRQAA